MVEEQIADCVRAHYGREGAPLLLLSGLGTQLSKATIWPAPGDTRSLHEAVAAAPGVRIMQDPDAKPYIAVVLEGDEARATNAIAARRRLSFLRRMPRPVLLAFTVEVAEGELMQLRLTPRPSYIVGPGPLQEGHLPVEADLRIRGLDVRDLGKLEPADGDRLSANIRTWLERHRVDLGGLSSHRVPTRTEGPAADWRDGAGNALDRLFAAQEPDVARRMTVPLDIAVALSRLP